jgi:hypothetical protein
MKIFSLLSLSAALIAAFVTLLVGSIPFYAVVPCTFLLLIVAGDYGPKLRRSRIRSVQFTETSVAKRASAHRYRLAA